jgi:hypothetical protein
LSSTSERSSSGPTRTRTKKGEIKKLNIIIIINVENRNLTQVRIIDLNFLIGRKRIIVRKRNLVHQIVIVPNMNISPARAARAHRAPASLRSHRAPVGDGVRGGV